MSTLNSNPIAKAVRTALIAGTAAAMAIPSVYAAEDGAKDEKITITGSRIKRSDVEGALPVTVIDRETIEMSGEVSVSDLVRNTTFNSFGSFRPQSGSSAQSFAGLSLRGLGESRTLILIDGRRAPSSPDTGQGQDLNSIPLAAVERIEILTDGASAVYGSDAIGGVVNIVTRKDFEGVQLSIEESKTKQEGGDTSTGSAIFGASSGKARMTGGISFNKRDIIFARDREWSSGGYSTFSNNFRSATPAPGTVYGYTDGGFLANPDRGSQVPGACDELGNGFTTLGSSTRCYYEYSLVSADEAASNNQALFLRGDYEVNADWTIYMNSSVSRSTSFGRYAPVPSSPWPGGAIFISTTSPNHPANRGIAGYDPAEPLFLRHRFAALGTRDANTEKNTYDLNIGAEATIGNFDIDFGARSTESKFIELGKNYVVGGLAQAAIESGAYDIYDPFNVDRAVLDSLIATISRDSGTRITEWYANASTELFEMDGGMASIAFGFETRKEEYYDIYDTLSSSGQIVGSAGNSAGGDRDVDAFFIEANFPVLDNLEIGFAARNDSYSDYGSDTSPKLSVRYQPLDELTVRASYGQGFRAPTLDIVTAQPQFSAEGANDPQTCIANGLAASCQLQLTTWQIANPNIESEQSDQYSFGFAYQPADWLNMTLDYWNIEVDGRVAYIGTARMINCLGANPTGLCPSGLSALPTNVNPPVSSNGLGLARDAVTGAIIYAQSGYTNLGTIEGNGIDFNTQADFDFGDMGSLKTNLQVSYMLEQSTDGGESYVHTASAPRYRAMLSNVWSYGDFSVVLNNSYIDETTSTWQDQYAPAYASYGYSAAVNSWLTHDLQVNWNTPWDGKVTVGVDNLADERPALDALHPSGRGYDMGLYDAYGRKTYVRYTQSF
ncbi:TonB-dependent receptor plug domain-containing protein [Pleionea litopenaei]|uniref:TonB-dependent receptor n=1 Tax=Pleionea litopenaei TaxID=3070815 RepID=A0AA51RS76_9GAMM|nr:TonB-dependent receptor [Pleionea sp. HL-JVS1]WMS86549.1 TonB-dependent receptor [Pleionea sp. HL-JVS1]